MEVEYDRYIRELNRLIGEGAPADKVLEKAREVKRALVERATALWKATNVIDNLVSYYVPNVQWEFGWVIPKQPSSRPSRPRVGSERQRRTLEMAKALTEEGHGTADTIVIVARLQAEGDTTPARALGTAIGNILTRSGEWRRVAPGKYAPVGEEAAM